MNNQGTSVAHKTTYENIDSQDDSQDSGSVCNKIEHCPASVVKSDDKYSREPDKKIRFSVVPGPSRRYKLTEPLEPESEESMFDDSGEDRGSPDMLTLLSAMKAKLEEMEKKLDGEVVETPTARKGRRATGTPPGMLPLEKIPTEGAPKEKSKKSKVDASVEARPSAEAEIIPLRPNRRRYKGLDGQERGPSKLEAPVPIVPRVATPGESLNERILASISHKSLTCAEIAKAIHRPLEQVQESMGLLRQYERVAHVEGFEDGARWRRRPETNEDTGAIRRLILELLHERPTGNRDLVRVTGRPVTEVQAHLVEIRRHENVWNYGSDRANLYYIQPDNAVPPPGRMDARLDPPRAKKRRK